MSNLVDMQLVSTREIPKSGTTGLGATCTYSIDNSHQLALHRGGTNGHSHPLALPTVRGQTFVLCET